jgi:exosortase
MEQRTTGAAAPVLETANPGAASRQTQTNLDARTQWRVLWLFGLGLAYWWVLLQRLSVDWSINPQYGYGWSVPLLVCWLGWRRWLDRPSPESSAWSLAWFLVLIGLLFSLMPARLVEEANPEWRLILWVHALTLTALSCGLLLYCGGWPWLRHFAFPVCFVLISVPWPSSVEQALIQGLTQIVARATVEILGLFGIVAFQHGNLIEVATGIVGVDEACSGVRSLQTSVMISLFLGELYRLTAGRRLLMLALGMALALVANLCRTFFLVWNAARHGIQSVDRWHDTAGLVIVGAVFAGLWLLAVRLRRARTIARPRSSSGQLLDGRERVSWHF